MANRTNRHKKPFHHGNPNLQQFPPNPLKAPVSLAGLTVTLLTLVVPVVVPIGTPEIRCQLGLQSESCPQKGDNKAEQLYQKGSDLLKLGRYPDALDSFNQAIDIDPKLAKAWNGRGAALEKLTKNQQALASYEKALLLDFSYEIARQNREELLLKQKQLRNRVNPID